MIGTGWWSTGITVTWVYSGEGQHGWAGSLNYLDAGFCSDSADAGRISTEGELRTRYAVRNGKDAYALTVVIDTLIADAQRLGITWQGTPTIYYRGDGEDENFPPPQGWRELLSQQTERLGWSAPVGQDQEAQS